MSAMESGFPVADDYKCRFSFQDGWVDLTLEGRTRAEAMGLAGAVMRHFNPVELSVDSRKLFDDLVDRAMDLNGDEPIMAAAYYTPGGIALADLMVDSYGEDGVPRPSPEEVTPLLLDWSNATIAGEPEVTNFDHPAGPAVRVHAMVSTKRLLGFGRQLGEFVKYAVFPPGFTSLVVVTVSWQRIHEHDDLTQITDDLVAGMQVVPVDADGNEIEPG
ncbi:hypothetical protein ACFVT5_00425 [Streptomyces sp. NPDC058001]|uniref:hypothetical protein n=1 Tax=Streptomyces sp. NPDC058001 TaxID=3346300 RepID=UPI0036E4EB04